MAFFERKYTDGEVKSIIEDIMSVIDEKDYDLDKDEDKKAFFVCYILWKLQSDPKIKSVGDIYTYMDERMHSPTLPLDDVVILLESKENALEKLCALKDKYSKQELAECVIYAGLQQDGYYHSKEQISELIDELLDIYDGDCICHMGGRILPFSLENQKKHPIDEYYFCGHYSYSTNLYVLSDVVGYNNITLLEEDDMIADDEEDGYSEKTFNKILVDAFDNDTTLRNYGYFIDECGEDFWRNSTNCNSGVWAACGIALSLLSEGGRAVALTDGGPLTVKQTRKVREYLCDRGYIESVIMLPDKMMDDTWVNQYLLVLSHNNKTVTFYDARNEYDVTRVRGKRINELSKQNINKIVSDFKNKTNGVSVDLSTIKASDYNLSPLRYMESNSEQKQISIGEAVREIKRGMSLSAADMDKVISDEGSNVKCIVPSSLERGVVSSFRYYQSEIKKPGKNEASYGNLLISKTGNPFKVAVAHERYLVVGNVYILDIDRTKINPAYVRCFLNSERGQEELKKYAVGASTPIISVSELQNVKIPIHDDDRQKELNKRCEEIESEIEQYYRMIADKEQQLNDLFE